MRSNNDTSSSRAVSDESEEEKKSMTFEETSDTKEWRNKIILKISG